ncbi:RHOMBOID-like protein 9, chloroplastic isoform X2 [Magnolia sinica]|uniref:RHOMBOID-like protein 9, chloroplastic isoform X2 n=1 Tax=Magnolia sinica TaxID=86752 RepID=UPI0026598B50|nr:RHOMBOID-like protein 9, chloroplastic isoform X2 [Magnolia sinica]
MYIMSTVPMCSNIFSKDHVLTITKLIRHNERGIADGNVSTGDVFRCFSSSIAGDVGRRWHVMRHTGELCAKAKMGEGADVFCTVQNRRPITFHAGIEEPVAHRVYSREGPEKSYSKNVLQRDKSCGESYGSNTSTNERQLKALDSYFSKLHNEMSGPPSMPKNEEYQMDPSSTQLLDKMIKSVDGSNQLKTKKGIGSLDDYFDKLNMGVHPPKKKLSSFDEKTTDSNEKSAPPSISGERHKRSEERINELNSYMLLESKNDENGLSAYGDENFQDLQHDDEASDLYMISILASINIAVFLFEIASPIGNSDVERLSLPLMYGAKINELILGGEWWRLVTPMFLHSGFLHVALGCWVLLTFGPQVCRGYGSFTFFLIYILGGISGNLSSFVHTPEATVGGTVRVQSLPYSELGSSTKFKTKR